MPSLPHLNLRRLAYEEPRRKRPGFGVIPPRNYQNHSSDLNSQLSNTISNSTAAPRLSTGVNPELILRVTVTNPVDEELWTKLGLTLLGQSDKHNLILFSDDHELNEFKQKLGRYSRGPGNNANPYLANIFSNIDEVGNIRSEDRIGKILKSEGVTQSTHFNTEEIYTLDVELWHVGNDRECSLKIDSLKRYIESKNGRLSDRYIGSSLVLVRISVSGEVVRELLEFEAISTIDLPPKVSFQIGTLIETSLGEFSNVPSPPPDAVGICTLDSGITNGHPLLAPAIGEATSVPDQLGEPYDQHGHGTMVSGLALYGDVKKCIEEGQFIPQLRLFSARVLNANNQFDNEKLITTQMVQAIRYFKDTYNCRVFNASLGDSRTPFNGGKISPWSSILDYLSRELDIVIIVSAGNYEYEPSSSSNYDEHITNYPNYLFDPPAKVIEPATGCNVLTVGAIAESAAVPPRSNDVDFRPIAGRLQPSPFTRSGPGIGGAIKPELVETGGNLVFCGLYQRARQLQETSILSTGKDYLMRLFSTDIGTSLAAPKTAHKAARLLQVFPNASANLIRALLVSSATVPNESIALLEDKKKVLKVCGYGIPSLEKSNLSDPNRVLLYSESDLAFDHFHIYEVPIPPEMYTIQGEKRISVTLAFDPPVRHSRLDYLGVKMSFRLIRGKSVDEVARAYRKRVGENNLERITGACNCNLEPKPTEREGGTLQKAVFSFRRADSIYGHTYYLVVRCQREWANMEDSPQRYAVVVTVEHQADVNLYTPIQAIVRPRVQVRRRR